MNPMPGPTTSYRSAPASSAASESARKPEITRDVVEYLTEYAKENPTSAALWCLGIGFVLGWKLKPW